VGTRKIHAREGDWFEIPLRRGQHGFGVVARLDRRKDVFLGYFFLESPGRAVDVSTIPLLRPDEADLVGRTSTFALENGEWRYVLHADDWDKERWPMPIFREGLQLVTYVGNDLLHPVLAEPNRVHVEPGAAPSESGLMDPGFVEERLWAIFRRRFE
jgi:Immunity protein 26